MIRSSVRCLVWARKRNAAPRYGMSPSHGTLRSALSSERRIRPPITTVCPSMVTTVVSACVMLNTGANTPGEI